MTFITFSEYGERSEMMHLVEEDCPRTQVGELSHITKVYYSMDNIKKLLSVSGSVNEILFEKKNERIAHQIRISVQISASQYIFGI
jgi:hypothetical protein